jgi:hypothetical protein
MDQMVVIMTTIVHCIVQPYFYLNLYTIAFRSFKLTKRGIIRLRDLLDILHSEQIIHPK